MSLQRIGGERESLTFASEVYKKSIRHYLESLGYSQTTDSFVEGHFPDMIFYNSEVAPGREFWIESKATNVSISEKKFSNELLNYLISWLKLPSEKRFTLWIFAQEVSRINRWEAIFKDYTKEAIDDWLSTHIPQLPEDKKNFLDDVDKNEIYTFFQNTIVTIGLSSKLDIAAEQKKETSKLSLSRKASSLLDESERRNQLIEEKSVLITNLLIFDYPRSIFKQKTHCKTVDEIYQIMAQSSLPPFMFSGGYLYSLCDPADLSVFDKILVGNSVYLNSSEYSQQNNQEFVKLLNLHLDKYARCRGLRKFIHNTYFFGLKPNENGDYKERKQISYTGLENFVAKPMYDKVEDKKLNYIFHRAVRLYVKFLWGKYYIVILPTRHFSTDGKTAIEGENKDRLDRKYRNPSFNRSDFFLRTTKFWKYYLFEKKFENPLFNNWYKNFNFGDLMKYNIIGIPQSIDKNQRMLFDSFGGE